MQGKEKNSDRIYRMNRICRIRDKNQKFFFLSCSSCFILFILSKVFLAVLPYTDCFSGRVTINVVP
jgi:hypothetical protein